MRNTVYALAPALAVIFLALASAPAPLSDADTVEPGGFPNAVWLYDVSDPADIYAVFHSMEDCEAERLGAEYSDEYACAERLRP